MRLEFPTLAYRDKIQEYKDEVIELGEEFQGSAFLSEFDNVEDWIDFVTANRFKETKREDLVCSSTYLVLDDADEIIGMIDIRHELNDYLSKIGGHIGYRIAPKYRGFGFGKQMLSLALLEADDIGLKRILITTGKNNTSSQKVIIHNGGIFECEVEDGNDILYRYWIDRGE